jgi:hypothetical protein
MSPLPSKWTKEEVIAVVEDWIKALRDGGYLQTRGRILAPANGNGRCADAYCCLGVLCQRLIDSGCRVRRKTVGLEIGFEADDHEEEGWASYSAIYLPSAIMLAIMKHLGEQFFYALANYNDHFRMPFKAIAVIVEARLKFAREKPLSQCSDLETIDEEAMTSAAYKEAISQ